MSVIIKGINKCINCEFCIYAEPVPYTPDARVCIMTGEYTHEKYGYIPEKCPITELPEKHGQLIDKAEYCLLNGCQPPYNDKDCANCIICDCKVILESEGNNE